ncbi:hypothetical protein [Legionella impletisoli]|uniref:Plasmid maintenance system killer protein n=1 Tax=Legionella impletisoli TaxID=343510 RepID=A0A917NCA8_9GAMM|nr:hypothetical protein [Legionella impletisoli]GGI87883.1 hypothetical protein GCM10007966_15810 [Legionella impletisoli]
MDIYTVVLPEKLKKDLRRIPKHVLVKLTAWINAVGHYGLSEVKKTPGYHDEPLKGDRKGQRSIRLSKAYRAIYIIDSSGKTQIVEIVEVNKHDY